MQHATTRWGLAALSGATTLALAACGSGGGSGTSSPAAAVATPKQAATPPVATSTPLTIQAAAAPSPRQADLCLFGDSIGSTLEKYIGRVRTSAVAYVAQELNQEDEAALAQTPNDPNAVWHNFEGSAWLISTYESITKWVIAVPIITHSPLVTMSGAAAGDYQQHYLTIAATLAQSGKGDAYIRIGWEFQGDWYPWGYNAQTAAEKANYCTDYKAAFRNVVAAFRAASPKFKFIWNPNLSDQYSMANIEACYPGDDVVDSIGLDVYDFDYSKISDPTARFEHDVLNRTYGLNWQAKFAALHNKPMSYPEWGIGEVGDNPTMMQAMGDWFNTQNVDLQCYWNGNAATGYNGALDSYPQQKAVYKTLFGAAPQFSVPEGALFVGGVSFGVESLQADGIQFQALGSAEARSQLAFATPVSFDAATTALSPSVSNPNLKTLLTSYATDSGGALTFTIPLAYTPQFATDAAAGATEYYVYLYSTEPTANEARSLEAVLEGTRKTGTTLLEQSTTTPTIGQQPLGGWSRYGPYAVSISDDAKPLSVTIDALRGTPVVDAVAIFRKAPD